jgi:hypothetical protein
MTKSLFFFAIMFTLLFHIKSSKAQAPNLGVAGSFVLFSSTGAVGNLGSSILTGDVGTNNGAITGFGNVNGNMRNADGTTGQAAADLLIAYNQLNGMIPTLFPGVLLGNGDTLEAGIYQSPALTTLSGDLYLDALGDSNAVFVFQIQAAFSTTVNTKIHLLNGAQACNIFWKVEGVVSMAPATYFQGTVIANNAAINMTTNDTLIGRALSTTGAVNVNALNAVTPLGCGTPILTGPAAPNLATAACYAIFSGNGSVINSGITYVTGDIGTNVGLTVGYNPLFVTGTIHPIPDVSTIDAAADLVTAYNTINVMPHDIELLFPAQFGNELVLTPHVYLLNAATAFNGTVYLNAQGNANAVFVIKVNGALSTSTFSKVVLLNGAQADNVYWNVDGAVSIADYSVFNGTIIANNAAIDLTTGDTLYGRALTTNGALSTANVFVESTSPCAALPLNWIYFSGTLVNNDVLLKWGTENEVNNDYFTIEKSNNGVDFEKLTTVKASPNHAKTRNEYLYTDRLTSNNNYYRIAQTDIDGQINYYKTINVNTFIQQLFTVNYAVNGPSIVVNTQGTNEGSGAIHLISIDGKVLSSQSIQLTNHASQYFINKPTTPGIYFVQLSFEGSIIHTGKVFVP